MTWELLTWHLTGTPGPRRAAQTASFHTALGHTAFPARVTTSPKLTWQAAHGHRISALSEAKCPSPETAWD